MSLLRVSLVDAGAQRRRSLSVGLGGVPRAVVLSVCPCSVLARVRCGVCGTVTGTILLPIDE